MLFLCTTDERTVRFTGRSTQPLAEQDDPRLQAECSATLRDVTSPEPPSGSPFQPWQWGELGALVLVIAVQLWLYRVSVPAAAAWGLLVPALVVHVYLWMGPLLREQRNEHGVD
jgi:hypothetical protein